MGNERGVDYNRTRQDAPRATSVQSMIRAVKSGAGLVSARPMDIFKEMEKRGHEQIIFNYDKVSGLKVIVAIHDTTLGPALGGCRMLPYPTEDAALEDAFRLSEGMTYKAAASGLDYGGGKAVILGDPTQDKSEALFRAFGRFIETLAGRYTTGEDVGTSGEDLVHALKETRYLVGLPRAYGGSGDTGDITALGVVNAMKASMMHLYGSESLRGRKIVVQGLGKVGFHVARRALEDGAEVIAADTNPHVVGRIASQLGVEPTDPWAVLETPCDIFSPCALGNIVNEDTIDRLQCRAIAGSANNQLQDISFGKRLRERDILYAPDFVANAGGLIQVADEMSGYRDERVRHQVDNIYPLLLSIFEESERRGLPTTEVAMELVGNRMTWVHEVRRIHVR